MRPALVSQLAAAAALALSSLALAGCGADDSATTAPAADGPKTEHIGGKSAHRQRGGGAAGGDLRCRAQVGEFVEGLDALREELVVGLTYGAYLKRVRALRARYRELPVDRLALACLLGVANPGEQALNRYIAAVNTWGECVAIPGCRAESVEAELQDEWRYATNFVLAARARLAM